MRKTKVCERRQKEIKINEARMCILVCLKYCKLMHGDYVGMIDADSRNFWG